MWRVADSCSPSVDRNDHSHAYSALTNQCAIFTANNEKSVIATRLVGSSKV